MVASKSVRPGVVTDPQPSEGFQDKLSVSVSPKVQRFFFIPKADIPMLEEQVITSDQFVNDQGDVSTGFPVYNEEGYYNLYINGLLQENLLYRVNPHSITMASTGGTIYAGTPIILESLGFIVKVSEK